MKTNLSVLVDRTVPVIYGSLLVVYVLFRAVLVPITFDEVSTFQIVQSDTWMHFGEIANNHVLNTILIKGTLQFFNPSELVLRLPNVLAFIVYFVFSLKISRLLCKSWSTPALVLLTAMPFLIDFFSLARGYGLSLACLMPSIYYVLMYAKEKRMLYGILTLLFGMLAVLSNFTLLNYFLPLLLVLLLLTWQHTYKTARRLWVFSLMLIPFFAFILPVIFQLKSAGALFFGGQRTFYHDTILTLSRCFAYKQLNISVADIVFAFMFILSILMALINLYHATKQRKLDERSIIALIFLLGVLSPIVQHLFLGTSYPVERTALMYYPLLILTFVGGINLERIREVSMWAMRVLALFFLVHFARTVNTSYSYTWMFESGSEEIIEFVKSEQQKTGSMLTLGLCPVYGQSSGYYNGQPPLEPIKMEFIVDRWWKYNYEIEELDPKYANASMFDIKKGFFKEDAEELFAGDYDYYYLPAYFVDKLSALGYTYTPVLKFDKAGSYLIQLEK